MQATSQPAWQLVFLFHADLRLFSRTLPRCLEALAAPSSEPYEVVVFADGTPPDVATQLVGELESWGVDELRIRRRSRYVASGDPSNNGHRRLFEGRSPYVAVVEDDVVMYRTSPDFDVLAACRSLFERHPQVTAISKVNDHDQWSWGLEDVGPHLEPGVRSVNRLSTHFVAYDVARFLDTAERFGAFEPDVFIDRSDLSYNWEDLVSHVGTTGGRCIAHPESWPLDVYHCDRKVGPGSKYHTQQPAVKAEILAELDERYGRAAGQA
jgi:hypothetical protein